MSIFLLILYVFLQSVPAYGWFNVDPKFTAFIGLAFIVAILIEGVIYYRGRHPFFHRTV